MSVRLDRVAFAHRPDAPLFADVTLHLRAGWTAIVGPNGAGKTTLLRLLEGSLAATAGTRTGPESVHRCPQEVGPPDDAMRAFAWGWTGVEPWAVQAALHLDPADLDRWPTLSWGERKRWQIGAALASRPELLLLDEPTNHLDAAGRALLVDALAGFRGTGVVVSHDRSLLRALATAVARVERGAVDLFPGGWDDAVAQWALERAARARQLDAASDAVRQAEQRLHATRTRHAASAARRAVRPKGPRDADARSMARKFRAQKAEASHGRAVEIDRRRAEAARDARAGLSAEKALGGDVRFASAPCPKARLLAFTGDLPLGERTLRVDLTLDRGERLWIRGPNGAGKSTVFRTLLADAQLPDARVLVLPQELAPDDGARALDALGSLPPDVRGRVLQVVALLGVDPSALLGSARPSPGEARKLRIALGIGRGAWLLALDEPTNHLDLPSIERLERALKAFDGAILLVTHDDALGAAVCGRALELPGGRGSPDGSPAR